jgi:UDP-N-acetylmuramoyl-L-alanyl-D-glutamate--2,6-diaminopimelate ligase
VIRAAMLAGTRDGSADVVEIADRTEAISYAVARAGPGDAVVVAGKGHETGQQVGASTHPFSDAEVLAGALADRSGQ